MNISEMLNDGTDNMFINLNIPVRKKSNELRYNLYVLEQETPEYYETSVISDTEFSDCI